MTKRNRNLSKTISTKVIHQDGMYKNQKGLLHSTLYKKLPLPASPSPLLMAV